MVVGEEKEPERDVIMGPSGEARRPPINDTPPYLVIDGPYEIYVSLPQHHLSLYIKRKGSQRGGISRARNPTTQELAMFDWVRAWIEEGRSPSLEKNGCQSLLTQVLLLDSLFSYLDCYVCLHPSLFMAYGLY